MMEVIEVSQMPCGTKIQIEDWSMDYNFLTTSGTIGAYPVALESGEGQFSPQKGQVFRMTFNFECPKALKEAFEKLKAGESKLIDYADLANDPRSIKYLKGR